MLVWAVSFVVNKHVYNFPVFFAHSVRINDLIAFNVEFKRGKLPLNSTSLLNGTINSRKHKKYENKRKVIRIE